MIVYVWVKGAVVVLLHPLFKDGRFVVGIGEFLLELEDGRELLVQRGSAAVGLSLFLKASSRTTRDAVGWSGGWLENDGTCFLMRKHLV